MPRLTAENLAELRALLNNNDRAGFYIKYYDLTIDLDPAGARQSLLQAHICSYSGFLGGGALLGNAIAKFSNPEKYTISLDAFSLAICWAMLGEIEKKVLAGESGALTKAEIFKSDNAVWDDLGLFEYFPGRILQIPITGLEHLLSGGSVAAIMSGIQLLFGDRVGFSSNDYSGLREDKRD